MSRTLTFSSPPPTIQVCVGWPVMRWMIAQETSVILLTAVSLLDKNPRSQNKNQFHAPRRGGATTGSCFCSKTKVGQRRSSLWFFLQICSPCCVLSLTISTPSILTSSIPAKMNIVHSFRSRPGNLLTFRSFLPSFAVGLVHHHHPDPSCKTRPFIRRVLL